MIVRVSEYNMINMAIGIAMITKVIEWLLVSMEKLRDTMGKVMKLEEIMSLARSADTIVKGMKFALIGEQALKHSMIKMDTEYKKISMAKQLSTIPKTT